MWKVGKKYKCIKTDTTKNFTEGKNYELFKISPFALAYNSPLYWFEDNKGTSRFIVKSLVDKMFQDIKEIRREKLKKLNEI
jgi:hypothetical protein